MTNFRDQPPINRLLRVHPLPWHLEEAAPAIIDINGRTVVDGSCVSRVVLDALWQTYLSLLQRD